MGKVSESEIVKLIRLAAQKRGWLFYDMRRAGVRGIPDVYMVTPQGPHWIEIKTKADRLRPAQDRFAAQHNFRSYSVFHEMDTVIETKESVKRFFEMWDYSI